MAKKEIKFRCSKHKNKIGSYKAILMHVIHENKLKKEIERECLIDEIDI